MSLTYPVRFAAANVRRMRNQASMPFLLNYCVTFRCNMCCSFCGCADVVHGYEKGSELTVDELDAALSDPMLKGLDVVVLSGGEPFMRDDIAELVHVFEQRVKPARFHITTNGYFTEKVISVIHILMAKGIRVDLKVSIDAVGEKHDALRGTIGAFDNVVKTLHMLRSRYNTKQLYLAVNHTLTQLNYMDIDGVKAVADDAHVDYRCFLALEKRPLYGQGVSPRYGITPLSQDASAEISSKIHSLYLAGAEKTAINDWAEGIVLRHYLRGQLRMIEGKVPVHRCMNLFTHFRLNPNGDIIPCSYDTTVLGNITQASFSRIISSVPYQEALKRVKKCGNCWLGCEVTPNWISSLGCF